MGKQSVSQIVLAARPSTHSLRAVADLPLPTDSTPTVAATHPSSVNFVKGALSAANKIRRQACTGDQ